MDNLLDWIERLNRVLMPQYSRCEDLEKRIYWIRSWINQDSDREWLDKLAEDEAKLRKTKKELEQVKRSVRILYSTWHTKRGKNLRRKRFTIYRLYRYLNFSLRDITYIVGGDSGVVKHHIGEAFKELCIKDEKCIFKPFLLRERK